MQDNQEKNNLAAGNDLAAEQPVAAAGSEVPTAPTGENTSEEATLRHLYLEVSNELLAKPTALVDLIQAEGHAPTLVFCNSPSEADFVDVMLKKNGILSQKMIGHVPASRVSAVLQQIKNGEATALVVTDVSAQDLAVSSFTLLINYSIHDDPEVYLHRISAENGLGQLRKIVSIISPLDFGNFHYLRKILQYEFQEAPRPSKEEVYQAQAQKFITQAEAGACLNDERVKVFVKTVLADPRCETAVALLAHNTLNVLPGLQSNAERGQEREGGEAEGRYDRRGRDRDRDRGDRDRGDRDRDRRRSDNSGRSYENNRGRSRDRNGRQWRNEDSGDYDREPRERHHRHAPPKRDVRYYVGHGAADSFTEDEFRALVAGLDQSAPEKIKRFSLRGKYSFVDIEEEAAEGIVASLKSAKRADGSELFVRKATYISGQREQDDEGAGEALLAEAGEGSPEERRDWDSADGASEESASDQGADQGSNESADAGTDEGEK